MNEEVTTQRPRMMSVAYRTASRGKHSRPVAR